MHRGCHEAASLAPLLRPGGRPPPPHPHPVPPMTHGTAAIPAASGSSTWQLLDLFAALGQASWHPKRRCGTGLSEALLSAEPRSLFRLRVSASPLPAPPLPESAWAGLALSDFRHTKLRNSTDSPRRQIYALFKAGMDEPENRLASRFRFLSGGQGSYRHTMISDERSDM